MDCVDPKKHTLSKGDNMSKVFCFNCGIDLLGSGPGSHNPRLCIEELLRVRDAALLRVEELRSILAQTAIAMETAECHGQHEDCTLCERIRFLMSKSQKRLCEKCGECPCMCATNAHHAMTGD